MRHFFDQWLLTILLCLPAGGAGAVLILRRRHAAARWTAIGVAIAALVAALLILVHFDWHRHGEYGYGRGGTVQMRCRAGHYVVAIDGLSFPFVVLMALIGLISCTTPWRGRLPPPEYLVLVLLLETTAIGAFMAFDLLLFWVFLLLGSIIACILVAIYGGPKRRGTASCLALLQLVALGCLLVTLIGLWSTSRRVFPGGTCDLVALASPQMHRLLQSVPHDASLWMAMAMITFLIRMAVVPTHCWFVHLLSEAPAPVSLLVGTLLPATGGYGLLRITGTLFPALSRANWAVIAIVAVISILYPAACAASQDNFKRIIAYMSISITGFALLGIVTNTTTAVNGAVFLLVSQALCLSLILILADVFFDRTGHADLDRVAVGAAMPGYAGVFVVSCLAYLVVPGLLGQVLVLFGLFRAAQGDSVLIVSGIARPGQIYALTIIGCVGVLAVSISILRMIRGILFVPTVPDAATYPDLNPREAWMLAPLALLIIALGVLPGPLCFTFTQSAIDALFRVQSPERGATAAMAVTPPHSDLGPAR